MVVTREHQDGRSAGSQFFCSTIPCRTATRTAKVVGSDYPEGIVRRYELVCGGHVVVYCALGQ